LDKDRSLIKRKDIDEHPLVITFIWRIKLQIIAQQLKV
jgi:hypothetical protein